MASKREQVLAALHARLAYPRWPCSAFTPIIRVGVKASFQLGRSTGWLRSMSNCRN